MEAHSFVNFNKIPFPCSKFMCLLVIIFSLQFLVSCGSMGRIQERNILFKEPPIEDGIQYGMASWYGEDFNGKPTASGEIYDMYGLSAAHRTLPLGTIVKVKNLDNGRDVELVINDRGPFVEGRIIDLSFGAASRLDMVKEGVVPVRLKVLGRDAKYIKGVKVSDAGNGDFAIQVGAFLEQGSADRLKNALGIKYDGVYIQTAVLDGKTYYRVRLGRYSDRKTALLYAERLSQEGYPVWVVRCGTK